MSAPNGATTRTGIEWTNNYHINSWLSAQLDAAFTRARFDANADSDDLGCDALNIANVKWNDIEYYYVSRLKNEPSPVADYVVHTGVLRTLRARFTYYF